MQIYPGLFFWIERTNCMARTQNQVLFHCTNLLFELLEHKNDLRQQFLSCNL